MENNINFEKSYCKATKVNFDALNKTSYVYIEKINKITDIRNAKYLMPILFAGRETMLLSQNKSMRSVEITFNSDTQLWEIVKDKT